MYQDGILLDLTDQIAKSEVIELENYYADIVNLYSYDGKHYAIPKDIDTIGLWYNKTYFDEAGLDYPDESWTWETLREAAKKLTREDGSVYGYAINTSNNQDRTPISFSGVLRFSLLSRKTGSRLVRRVVTFVRLLAQRLTRTQLHSHRRPFQYHSVRLIRNYFCNEAY